MLLWQKHLHLQINIWLLRFFLDLLREFTVFYTFDNVSLSNGFRGWKNAYFCRNLFLQTGFGNSFPLEFIFSRKLLEWSKFFNWNVQKVSIHFRQKRSNVLFYVDMVLGGGGSYFWQLFEDAILKASLTGKSSLAKKVLTQNYYLSKKSCHFSLS